MLTNLPEHHEFRSTVSAKNPSVITIDGPAASGKSSVSRALARRLGWKWVSTGAFYRGLAYVSAREGVAVGDVSGLVALAKSPLWEVRLDEDQTRVFYHGQGVTGQNVTSEVLSESNGTLASQVSQIPEVRAALLQSQRDCAKSGVGLVAEGRDCGTVVFPNAILKLYLTASQEERALRRAREQGLDLKETQNQQVARDRQDSTRKAAPLQIPADARVIDSGGMTLEEVVEQAYSGAREALARSVKSF